MANKVKPAPRKRTNGYKMPDPLPNGEILQDINKKQWKLGPSIGKGGFGEIYSAQEVTGDTKKNNQYPYVVKIEPHANGPLFVEMHFLLRNAKKNDVEAFITEKKLSNLGMPVYIGSGSHEHNKEKYRFVVIQKFGSDIWKLFLENKRIFPAVTVFKIGNQIIDVLEYIHSRGYVHHDIKGANILLDLKNKNQVYLVDFGLAGHYFTGKDFKPDPKKSHDGTLEYVSRDGHKGVQTRRSDLEILGYNLVQWLGCRLPWEHLKDPPAVQQSKEKYMKDIPEFMKVCFVENNPPKAIIEYFIYLNTLEFDTSPDYKKLRKILQNGIDSAGGSLKSPLVFKNSKTPIKRKSAAETPSSGKKPRLPRRKLDVDTEDDDENTAKSSDSDPEVKKKRPRKKKTFPKCDAQDDETPKKPIEDVEEDIETEVKKKRVIRKKPIGKSASQEDPAPETPTKDDLNSSTNGFTAEMKRIKDKIKSTKTKPKSAKVTKPKASTSNGTRKARSKVLKESDSEEEDEDVSVSDDSPPPRRSPRRALRNQAKD